MPPAPGGYIWRLSNHCLNDGHENYDNAMRVELGEYQTKSVKKHFWSRNKDKVVKLWFNAVPHRYVFLTDGGTVEDNVIKTANAMIEEYNRNLVLIEKRQRAKSIEGEYS